MFQILMSRTLFFCTQELHINKVTEYQNIVCSNDSYYKCLAKRFIDYKISVESKRLRNHVSNGYSIKEFCTPFSLPFDTISLEQIPICGNESAKVYFETVLAELEEASKPTVRGHALYKNLIPDIAIDLLRVLAITLTETITPTPSIIKINSLWNTALLYQKAQGTYSQRNHSRRSKLNIGVPME